MQGGMRLAWVLFSVLWLAACPLAQDAPGVIVEAVDTDSPAAKAGILVGDRLLTYDGKPLASPFALQAVQENTFGKETAVLRLERGGQVVEIAVPLGPLGGQVRPDLSPQALRLYQAGRAALEAGAPEEGIAKLTAAAEVAGSEAQAAWLRLRAGQVLDEHGQGDKAREAHEQAWALLEGSGDMAARSRTSAYLGLSQLNLQDLTAARDSFQAALELDEAAGYRLWAALDLTNLGAVAYDRGDLDAAEDYYTRALAIEEELTPDSLDVADGLVHLGNVAGVRGDLDAAQDYYNRALAIQERLSPDSLEVARTVYNLGIMAIKRGDLDAAEDDHLIALAIRERLAPDSLDVAVSLHCLGGIDHLRGDLDVAEDYYRRALAIEERVAPDSLDVANTLNNLGYLAYERGDLDAAEYDYLIALAIRERLAPDSLDVADSLCNLGIIYLDWGLTDEAEDHHKRALAIRERLAPDSLGVATSLVNLAHLAVTRSDLAAAEDYCKHALTIRGRLAPDSLEVANSLDALGWFATKRGDLDAAEDYHSRALASCEQLAPGSLQLAHTLENLGFCRLGQKRFADALTLFTRAVGIFETERGRLASPEARGLFGSKQTRAYTGLLRTYLGLNDAGAAFATLERARARGLVELLRERRMDFGGDVPAELLARQEAVQQARAAAYKRLGELDPNRDGDQIQTLRSQLVQYAVQQRELEADVRRTSPKYAYLHDPQPLDFDGARAALDPGTLLLAYSVDAEETYLFAVVASRGDKPDAPASQGTAPEPQHEGLQLYRIPVKDTELGERVRAFRAALTGESQALRAELATVEERPVRDAKAAVTQGKELYDLLVRPAQALVDQAERVLICPDWLLNSVPFAALVVEDGADGVRYFADVKPLHTIVSMTVYAQLRKQAQPAQTTATEQPVLLAFGDPVYGAREPDAAQTERRGGDALRRRVLTPLPGTRDEVEAIGKLYGAEPLLGPQATETAAKQEGRKAPILHFACHGLLDDLDPLASGLALTASEADDGLLRAWEIFESVRLDADLVVLSACETGLGQTTASEGVVGLTRALQYAGARSVLVSLWSVSDASTAALMTAFYRELRAGASKDVALQRAMAEVRNDPNNPRWQHPFHWAPFVLVGDWQ